MRSSGVSGAYKGFLGVRVPLKGSIRVPKGFRVFGALGLRVFRV